MSNMSCPSEAVTSDYIFSCGCPKQLVAKYKTDVYLFKFVSAATWNWLVTPQVKFSSSALTKLFVQTTDRPLYIGRLNAEHWPPLMLSRQKKMYQRLLKWRTHKRGKLSNESLIAIVIAWVMSAATGPVPWGHKEKLPTLFNWICLSLE